METTEHLDQSMYQTLQEISPEDLVWETIVDRDQIEKHLLTYNRDSFRAAAESPCGHGPIYDAISFSSLSKPAEELLYGEVPEDWYGDNVRLKEFLASFAIPKEVQDAPEIPTSISPEDVLCGFKAWKETTSTSPSGRHMGHYKALIQNPVLLQCFVQFMNIAISRGIAIL